MVIGHGLMAQAFQAYQLNKSVVIFASGVSNSNETNEDEFNREFNLLKTTINEYPDAIFIYFSTCSIEDASVKSNLYVMHKLAIEQFIAQHVRSYIIFRISNVVGIGGNPNTLINFLVQAVKQEKTISIWQNAERNIIDIEDVKYVVDYVLQNNFKNEIINIAFRNSFLVTDILKVIEQFLSKKAKIKRIEKGNSLNIDTTKIGPALQIIEREKHKDLKYIMHLLKKYYNYI